MLYEKRHILTCDRNPDGGEDYEVAEFLASTVVLAWKGDGSPYGWNNYTLRPAFAVSLGGRCWLKEWSWSAQGHYTASGYGADLIPFDEGLHIFLERDVFAFPEPDTV